MTQRHAHAPLAGMHQPRVAHSRDTISGDPACLREKCAVVYEGVEQFLTNVRAPVRARSRVRSSPASFITRSCQCSKSNTSFCSQTCGSCISHGSFPRLSRTWYVLIELEPEGIAKLGSPTAHWDSKWSGSSIWFDG